MTPMSSSHDSDLRFLPEVGDGPRLQAPPKSVVRVAAMAILALALLGLIRGAISTRSASQTASPLAVLAGLSPAASAAAKPAVILPRDDGWSTLSGPRMLDAKDKPAAPEAKPAASDDEQDDDSASPAAATAAADAIAPDAPDAAPAAQAAASSTATPPASPPPAPAPQ